MKENKPVLKHNKPKRRQKVLEAREKMVGYLKNDENVEAKKKMLGLWKKTTKT